MNYAEHNAAAACALDEKIDAAIEGVLVVSVVRRTPYDILGETVSQLNLRFVPTPRGDAEPMSAGIIAMRRRQGLRLSLAAGLLSHAIRWEAALDTRKNH